MEQNVSDNSLSVALSYLSTILFPVDMFGPPSYTFLLFGDSYSVEQASEQAAAAAASRTEQRMNQGQNEWIYVSTGGRSTDAMIISRYYLLFNM